MRVCPSDALNNSKIPSNATTNNDRVGNICQECCEKKAVVFFIGGASDAEGWLCCIATHNMDYTRKEFVRIHTIDNIENCICYYLGYEHIFEESDIQSNIIDKVKDKNNTAIYLVGHSLGGWNGAHLSKKLVDAGFNVDMLVTLDPVGTGILVRSIADIFSDSPNPLANYWANVICIPESSDLTDHVAKAGGQWETDISPDLPVIFSGNHKESFRMLCETDLHTRASDDSPLAKPISEILYTRIINFLKG